MNRVPLDILRCIFSFCNFRRARDYLYLRQVCSYWKQAVEGLSRISDRVSPDQFHPLVALFPRIQRLGISPDMPLRNSRDLSTLRALPSLSSNLRKISIFDLTPDLSQLISQLPTLEQLKVSRFSDPVPFPPVSSIKIVSLHGVVGLKSLQSLSNKLTTLQVIRLVRNERLDLLRSLTSLKTLQLGRVEPGLVPMDVRFLSCLLELETLELHQPVNLTSLIHAIPRLTKLRQLILQAELTAQGLDHFYQVLRSLPHLRQIRFALHSGTPLNESACNTLAKLSALRSLHVRCYEISPSIGCVTQLTELSLEKIPLSSQVLRRLGESLGSLRSLAFHDCQSADLDWLATLTGLRRLKLGITLRRPKRSEFGPAPEPPPGS